MWWGCILPIWLPPKRNLLSWSPGAQIPKLKPLHTQLLATCFTKKIGSFVKAKTMIAILFISNLTISWLLNTANLKVYPLPRQARELYSIYAREREWVSELWAWAYWMGSKGIKKAIWDFSLNASHVRITGQVKVLHQNFFWTLWHLLSLCYLCWSTCPFHWDFPLCSL